MVLWFRVALLLLFLRIVITNNDTNSSGTVEFPDNDNASALSNSSGNEISSHNDFDLHDGSFYEDADDHEVSENLDQLPRRSTRLSKPVDCLNL